MQLVQLSDIHFGSFFKQQVFDTVVEEVNKLNPDAIIITGDLTDEDLLFQFEYAMFWQEIMIIIIQDIWYSRNSFHQNKFMNLMRQ